MHEIVCPLAALVPLVCLPGKAYGPRGLASPAGLASLVAHAAFAGAPGSLCLYAAGPGSEGMAMLLTLAGTVGALAILLPRVVVVRPPAPASAPATPDLEPRRVGLVSIVPSQEVGAARWLQAEVSRPGTPEASAASTTG